MSVSQIPNLPSATALNGTEQLEAVQSGTSVKLTTAQIGTYVATTYPAPGISSVTANSPLTSTTVSGAVTITFPTASVTNAYLGQMPGGTVKANVTGGTASPSDVTPSAILDTFGTAVGSLLYRGGSSWAAITPGTANQVFTSNGTTSAPSWQTLSVPSGGIAPTGVTAGTYGSASSVPQFTVLTSGQLSAASNVAITIPYTSVTGLGSMATQNASSVTITGGTLNSVAIGNSTPGPGSFTALVATGATNLATIASGTWNGSAIAIAYGGTGATTAASARSNLGAAASGANSDITSLTGLTTPLAENEGGTGYGSYTTGDLLYAASSSTLARLNDVATGNSLISGGVGAAPSWGKIGLTTHVSGTLPVANGGTGATTLTGYLVGNGTGAFTAVATIPNAGLTNSAVTIGSTSISLGGTAATISGLTTLTLTQDPTANLQASTKQYVDNQVATVSNTTFHASSYASATGNLTATYSNGTGGVGATLTNAGALAAFTTDGTTPPLNSRILVPFQTSALQNGIYTLTTVGDGTSIPWVLTRATDFNTVGTGPNFIETGAATFVNNGSVYGASGWVMNATGTITVGSTALTWAQTSSSSSVTVSSPLVKTGSNITLGIVPATLGGTGLAALTQYNVLLGNGTGNVAFAAPGATGYPLLSTGAASNPAFGQLPLATGVTGTLPVGNGGTGTATAFTSGSVVFAGSSGVYSQNNTKLFWDNTNNRLGVNTGSPQTQLTILSNSQTVTPTAALPAGTDIYIVGANAANTRITQDAYGTGAYGVFTARAARGTAAAPTASQADDTLAQFTARGYGTTGFSAASVAYIGMYAAENFTDTAQGSYLTLETTALGANSLTEKFRVGPSGQWGIFSGTANYGTAGQVFTSGGASAQPTWSTISATTLSGVLPVASGGTNISSYTIGDILYASGATTLSKLADVATGNALISGGVGAAPSWGKIGLTTHVSGTLPIANGGTALTSTPVDGQLLIGSTSGSNYALGTLTAGTGVSITNGSGSITIANTGVSSLIAGTNISVSAATGGVTVSTIANPTFATSVTSPLILGGTGTSSPLVIQSTSGAGTTDSITFKVGNNGATTAMSIVSGGTVTIGTLSLTNALGVGSGGTGLTSVPLNGQIDIGNGTNFTRTTITAGTAVSVTNGAGSITIANTGVTSAVAGTGITVSAATGAVTITNSGVTSFSAGTTGLTPSTGTSGAVTLAGTLAVANGGTGLTSTPANGALDIGNGTNFTRTTLTAGTGVTITNGAGSISIAIGQAVGTADNVQHNSLGVGTAASGTTGEIRATNAITAYYSDDRLKTRKGNIQNALAKLETLNGFNYEANEVAQALGYKVKPEVGVSAQEVQAVMPEVVVPAPIDEKYLTVHYERMVPLLIEAIKELSAKVKQLETK